MEHIHPTLISILEPECIISSLVSSPYSYEVVVPNYPPKHMQYGRLEIPRGTDYKNNTQVTSMFKHRAVVDNNQSIHHNYYRSRYTRSTLENFLMLTAGILIFAVIVDGVTGTRLIPL
jgi:hypothetical protein